MTESVKYKDLDFILVQTEMWKVTVTTSPIKNLVLRRIGMRR